MHPYRWEPYGVRIHAAQRTVEEWNQHQGIIDALHAEGRTHKQILAVLKNKHDFEISIGQLRRRLLQARPRNPAPPNGEEKMFRELTTIFDEGIEADINPGEVPTIVTHVGFESGQPQAWLREIPASNSSNTILLRDQIAARVTVDSVQTTSSQTDSHAEMDADPDEPPGEWPKLREEVYRGINKKRRYYHQIDTAAGISGNIRLRHETRQAKSTMHVCCDCGKLGSSKKCTKCQHVQCSSCEPGLSLKSIVSDHQNQQRAPPNHATMSVQNPCDVKTSCRHKLSKGSSSIDCP